MMKAERKFGILAAVGSALLALSACEYTPPEPDDQECDCAEETAGADAPEAEPTASIFGPEAEVPEPDAKPEPLEVTIGFPDGGAELDADAVAALEVLLGSEHIKDSGSIVLGGHSDAGGDDAANMKASEARGLTVAAWLIERGVAEDRIEVIAFGEQNPQEPNALPNGAPNEAGRASNRRVDVTVAAAMPGERPTAPAIATEEPE